MKLARWLIVIGSLLLLFGAVLHSYGYRFVMPTVAASNIGPGLLSVFKALWWVFSVQSALLCPVIIRASRLPNGRGVVLLSALIPAAVAIVGFCFLGVFPGSVINGLAAVLLALGGFLLPKSA